MTKSIDISVLKVSNKITGEILDLKVLGSVDDRDRNTCVTYPHKYVSLEQAKIAMSNFSEVTKKYVAGCLINDEDFILDDAACHLPSIGDVEVNVETHTVEIDV